MTSETRRRPGPLLIVLTIVAGLALVAVAVSALARVSNDRAHESLEESASESARYDESYDPTNDYLIDTPCFSFAGPTGWINHQKDALDADCKARLEDHAPRNESGVFVFDPEPNEYGSVRVTPNFGVKPLASVDMTIDGMDASLERTSAGSMEMVSIVVTVPETRSNYYGEFDSLVITVEAESADIDDIVDLVTESWEWK